VGYPCGRLWVQGDATVRRGGGADFRKPERPPKSPSRIYPLSYLISSAIFRRRPTVITGIQCRPRRFGNEIYMRADTGLFPKQRCCIPVIDPLASPSQNFDRLWEMWIAGDGDRLTWTTYLSNAYQPRPFSHNISEKPIVFSILRVVYVTRTSGKMVKSQ
jgi:hypothetical protein